MVRNIILLSVSLPTYGVGWSDARLNKMVPIRPTHWRLWARD